MQDLIERRAALTALCEDCLRKYDGICPHPASRCVEFRTIKQLPAIEAETVRHGRWILCKDQYNVDNDNGNYAYYCSCCKHQDVHDESAKVSFCWNCGARMDGGADNG